ncbi:MAG: RidA family protein [Evtepia sp.]|uniref:RidA family protein n=1 Tax=Evtepia sp. TaxID=2773933 RepID=UPI002A757E67|nr:RidA family protein [Evtepia sp.]MDY3015033.1 RidA family protein [Evtepia sp.]
MEILYTDKAPEAIGPYSQAIEAGGLVFLSGQLGIIPDTGALAHSLAAQTVQALENVSCVLKAANLTLKDVVKTTCYLKNMEDFALFNEIYGQYFGDHKPARSCFAVAQLPKDGLVEIEVVAEKKA